MQTVHLICGSTGAGKTTYAVALAERASAVRFSIDPWMATLFWPDAPPKPDLAWALERIDRCETLIWSTAVEVLGRGMDVVLDLGLSTRAHRDSFRARAREANVQVILHFLDVERDVRKKRVESRNDQKTATFSFTVTDAMFDFMEERFERPAEEELVGAVVIPSW